MCLVCYIYIYIYNDYEGVWQSSLRIVVCSFLKYVWVKKCVEMCVMQFENCCLCLRFQFFFFFFPWDSRIKFWDFKVQVLHLNDSLFFHLVRRSQHFKEYQSVHLLNFKIVVKTPSELFYWPIYFINFTYQPNQYFQLMYCQN